MQTIINKIVIIEPQFNGKYYGSRSNRVLIFISKITRFFPVMARNIIVSIYVHNCEWNLNFSSVHNM